MTHRYLAVLTALTLAGASAPLAAWAAGDQAFLTKAMEGDNSEATLGKIAEQKGASAATRDYGRMLVADHTKARTEALPVAKAHGVAATDTLQPAAVKERQKLAGLSGPAFDREFARYMVKDHKDDISDFSKAAASGDAATAALARKTLPVLRKHLATAEQLSGQH